jgi:hypothetical protein
MSNGNDDTGWARQLRSGRRGRGGKREPRREGNAARIGEAEIYDLPKLVFEISQRQSTGLP